MAENAPVENPAPAPVPTIHVHVPGPDLRIDPFEIPEEPLHVGKAWEEWLLDLEEAMDYYEVNEEKKLKALKQFGGKELKRLIRTLPDPQAIENDTDYKRSHPRRRH